MVDFNRGGEDFDRRQLNANPQGRDYYNQNRFGPQGNGPPMMRGNNMQFGPRNNNPMFMWQSRTGSLFYFIFQQIFELRKRKR